MSEEQKKKLSESHKGQPGYWLGKKRSEEDKMKMSLAKKGKPNRRKGTKGWTPWNKGKKYTKEQKKNMVLPLKRMGPENNRWKGGITPENHRMRSSLDMKIRRKSCFERDGFVCQKCKISGGHLHVHHINNFSEYPELRLAIDNGITLCKECHHLFHKIYSNKNNTIEQFNQFLLLNI